MRHADFIIGGLYWCGGREWRCTDIGTHTICGSCLDDTEIVTHSYDSAAPIGSATLTRSEAEAKGWFIGPTYKVAELVFDEYDMVGSSFKKDE